VPGAAPSAKRSGAYPSGGYDFLAEDHSCRRKLVAYLVGRLGLRASNSFKAVSSSYYLPIIIYHCIDLQLVLKL
jgi:hypothetical protein